MPSQINSAVPRRGEARRDETRRDETRRDETRRDDARQDEVKRDETRRDETRRASTISLRPSSIPGSRLRLRLRLRHFFVVVDGENVSSSIHTDTHIHTNMAGTRVAIATRAGSTGARNVSR